MEVENISSETQKINLNDSETSSTTETQSNSNVSLVDQLKLLPECPSRKREPVVLKLRELNPYITCGLCGGYLYEASTITECMHTFCKTCLVRYTERFLNCPTCDSPIHPTDPFVHIRHDCTIQDIVYRLLPKIAEEEQRREKEFYEKHERETGEQIMPKLQLPPSPPKTPPPRTDQPPLPSEVMKMRKEREIQSGQYHSQFVSLYLQQTMEEEHLDQDFELDNKYVRVTQRATVGHVGSFVQKKLLLGNFYHVDIFHPTEVETYGVIEATTTLQQIRDDNYGGQDCIIELHYRITPKDSDGVEGSET